MIVRLALPLCIGSVCINISMLFVQSLVNSYGVIASSVNGVGSKLDMVIQAVTYLRINIWNYLALALMGPASGLLVGVGSTRLNMVISLPDGVVARIGLSVLFGTVMGMGLGGYWIGGALAGYVTAVLGWIYFAMRRWKNKVLV